MLLIHLHELWSNQEVHSILAIFIVSGCKVFIRSNMSWWYVILVAFVNMIFLYSMHKLYTCIVIGVQGFSNDIFLFLLMAYDFRLLMKFVMTFSCEFWGEALFEKWEMDPFQ
jgi:hypothetical protein